MKKIILIFLIIIISTPSYSQQSLSSQTGPYAKSFGEDNNYGDCKDPVGHWRKSECRIFNFSQTDKTLTARPITPSKDPINFNFMKKLQIRTLILPLRNFRIIL